MSKLIRIYVKAEPTYVDLDNEEDGAHFARHIARECDGKSVDHIIVNLCGGVYLDYWGCSSITDQCIDIVKTTLAKHNHAGKISIITSFRNEERAEYAWLFFYKSKHLLKAEHSYDDMSTAVVEVCKSKNIVFEIFIKQFDYEYVDYDSLGNAEVTLSSK